MQVLLLLKSIIYFSYEEKKIHLTKEIYVESQWVTGLCVKKREAYFTRKSVGGFGVGFQITCIHASHMLHEGLQLAAEALFYKNNI